MKFFRIRLRRSIFQTRSRQMYLAHKETARAIVHEKVRQFNAHYNVHVGKIAIRNQKSRWGSCSRKGNLNFSYKIVHLPQHLADYLIVHELCHIKEFNHGKGFWELVAQKVPDYKKHRKELRAVR